MHVSPVNSTPSITPATDHRAGVSPSGDSSGASPPFRDVMSRFLGEVNNQQLQAGQQVTQLATGEADSINDVVLSVTKADLSFRLLMEIRNRLISSYQEIQRMQV